ncbi:hypothetical protein ZOSMA_171G00420 [Zostera marina]|uniref:BHLH domain-containing protein n=1 Tax=Zostera marina TaxID=29655 RepID=A0A0K9PUM4_ZOSMR|nr:hypothetical protein ZOSMA_171G00420 [Zostera marina]
MSSSLKHSQRRFIIFDRQGSRTRPMFGSFSPVHLRQPSSVCNFEADPPLPSAVVKEKQTDESSASKEQKGDEIHEDTEEIDALLYSDSEEEEEEASSGYHPPIVSDVISSSGSPVKKRRLNDDGGVSLQDTASSSNSHDGSRGTGVDLSHIGKLSKDEKKSPDMNISISISIHETLGILRRIIPDGAEGKNPTRIIDEAISYLMFLKGCI